MRYMQSYELFSGLRQGRNLVGVDIGQKSLALSISDPGHQLAYPLCVLPKDPDLMKSPYLMKVFMADNNADDLLLFGYPYLRWTANPLAVHIKNTIDGLDGSGLLDDVNYAHWDETYTTKLSDMNQIG
ncbi:pre-16S rRNA nuclease, partial [Tanacetum coccineum]